MQSSRATNVMVSGGGALDPDLQCGPLTPVFTHHLMNDLSPPEPFDTIRHPSPSPSPKHHEKPNAYLRTSLPSLLHAILLYVFILFASSPNECSQS